MRNIFNLLRNTSEEKNALDVAPWLIVGLGNPGAKYEKTWHNAGFLAIEVFSKKHGISVNKIKFKGLCGQGIIGDSKVYILKPATYMNNSGESVKEAASFFKISAERIILVYDDIDIECGKIRIRQDGSAGTHNGVRSVLSHLGTAGFNRVRIGIGPLPEFRDIADYVLSDIPKERQEEMFTGFVNASDAITRIITEGIKPAMNVYNRKETK